MQASRPHDRRRLAVLRAAQAVMAVTGTIGAAGVLYFTLVDPPEGGLDLRDAVSAVWGGASGVALVVAAIALGLRRAWAARFAVTAVVAHAGLTLFKLTAYDESEAAAFLVADVVLLALLAFEAAAAERRQPAGAR